MFVALSHPTGNRNVRAVMNALQQAGMLYKFYTTIGLEKPLRNSWMPASLQAEINRRQFDVPAARLCSFPNREALRLVLNKIGSKKLTQGYDAPFGINKVYRYFDQLVAHSLTNASPDSFDAVYAYEDGAAASFEAAKTRGKFCIYDLPIAYWKTLRQLLENEAERYPDWSPTISAGLNDPANKLANKDHELKMADMVVVPSKFVLDSLPGEARNKPCIVSPFGSPASYWTGTPEPRPYDGKKLRVLFAGSMSQRKGLADLFKAVNLLNTTQLELVVMGSPQLPLEFYKSQCSRFVYEAGRPNDQVLALMRTCDVLCLPSVVEGRALVMQEALSQGVPLIVTANTGGEDLVEDGKAGMLVPVSDPEAIANALLYCINHPAALNKMKINAVTKAAAYSWKSYGAQIINGITKNFVGAMQHANA